MPISTGVATEDGWEMVDGYPGRSSYVVVVEDDLVIGGEHVPENETETLAVAFAIGRYFPVGCSVYYVRLDGQKIVESRKIRDIQR